MVGVSALLDTDISIEVMRGRFPEIDRRFNEEPEPRISTITLMELAFGVLRSPRRRREQQLLTGYADLVPAEPFDERAAISAARVRAELTAAGTPIGRYDTLIAGHALALGVPLVTRNRREFERVEGLTLEVW
ncbi:PIN domain-containing protein [Nocardioides sp.]|uniref:PIN domain-containing protein n=1 Tax=Nocardioides sp. TaxID=35761 RepID=UPI0039E2C0B2